MSAAGLARRAREIGPFGASVALYQGARFAVSLVAAVHLGPETFGAWVLLTLVLMYSPILTLGVPNGAGLEIPVRLGAGDESAAARVEDAATAVTVAGGLLAGGVAFGFVGWYLGGEDDRWLVAGLMAANAVAQQVVLMFQVLFRSRLAFDAAAIQYAIGAVVLGAAGLLLVRFGLVGLALSLLLGQAAAIAASVILLPRRPGLAWSPAAVRRLAGVGLPILLAGFGFIVLTTIDRWLVAGFLGEVALGVYGLVGLVEAGLLLVVSIVSQQEYPRMARALGAGADHAELLRLARGQGLTAAVLAGLGAIVAVAAAFIVVPIAAPAYRDALLPMAVVSLGVVAYGASSGYANVMNTVGRQREYLALQLLAIAAAATLMTLALALGAGLIGVAGAIAVVLAGYAVAIRARARQPMPAGGAAGDGAGSLPPTLLGA